MVTYIIVILLALLISAVIFGSFLKGKKHKQKQLRIAETYDRIAREFKLAIEYSEFLSYRYIGLDRKNRKLILIDHCRNEKQEECISLYEIGESKIIQVKDEYQNIKSIFLELKNRRNNNSIKFNFYNRDHDLEVELPSLFRKALQWKSKVDVHRHRGNIYLEAEYVL
jgi:hypothetical protein